MLRSETRYQPLHRNGNKASERATIRRSPLTRLHQWGLVLAAIYLLLRHPEAAGPILALLAAGLLAEWAPATWRNRYFGEALLLVIGCATCLWAWELDHDLALPGTSLGALPALQGWLRQLAVTWVLVPSRPGYLRWLAGLVAIELLLVGQSGSAALPPLAGAALGLGAIAALAADAWICGQINLPSSVLREAKVARPGLLLRPLLLAALLALLLQPLLWHLAPVAPADLEATRSLAALWGDASGLRDLSQTMSLDDDRFAQEDPTVMAHLDSEVDIDQQIVYLRALALPRLNERGRQLGWTSADRADRSLPGQPQLHEGPEQGRGRLWRESGSGSVVLLPDGAPWVGLEGLMADADGNLYRPGLGQAPTRYEVALGAAATRPFGRLDLAASDLLRQVPQALRSAFQRHIPDELARWRSLPPERAAEEISAWLRARAHYSLDDLPRGTRAGEELLEFLFHHDPARRRGHCQFFATAAVLLLRSCGHSARPVVGYASGEHDAQGVTFRARNAHAWAEVLLPGPEPAWRRIDPTPPDILAERSRGINDPDFDPGNEYIEAGPARSESLLSGRRGALAVGGLLLLAAWLIWRGRRRAAGNPRVAALQRQSDALLALARELGLPTDPARSMAMIVRDLEGCSGLDLSQDLAAHLAARFGHGPLPPPWPLARIRASSRALRATRKRSELPIAS